MYVKIWILKIVHVEDNKLKLSFYVIKDLEWFGGEHLGASPWCLGFKPWWMHALMYVMCIYIDVSCVKIWYAKHVWW
jgi:hypothetical protein